MNGKWLPDNKNIVSTWQSKINTKTSLFINAACETSSQQTDNKSVYRLLSINKTR